VYLYAFLSDADMQTVMSYFGHYDSNDGIFLNFLRVPCKNLIIYVRVCAVRVRILKKMCHYCPTVHE